MNSKHKHFTFVLTFLLIAICLSGCEAQEQKSKKEQYEKEISELKQEESALEESIDTLKSKETSEKIRTGTEIYVVVISIKQSHLSLDIEEHIKDSMNAVDIPIPVSKEFYDSINVGDVLDNSFRMGSFVMKGSFGKWNIKIADKYVE